MNFIENIKPDEENVIVSVILLNDKDIEFI